MDKPQIIIYSQKSVSYTPFDVKWIPSSPRFVVLGQQPNGSGIIQVSKLNQGSIDLVTEVEKPFAFKCGTVRFDRRIATGDFGGRVCVWDPNNLQKPVTVIKGHEGLINCIDSCGGTLNTGPDELVTGSRDGTVKVWDVRQSTPVCVLEPEGGAVDPWAVAFGNSYTNEDRVLAAGYENGDIKLFDMRQMKLLWSTNLQNGVCGVEFDRRDIKMNKLVCATLESKVALFDMRTYHPEKGYSSLVQKVSKDNTTGWAVKHLPQNRDVFMVSSGAGNLDILKYCYPPARVKKDDDGKEEGVMGRIEKVQNATLAEQPISSFDWSPDKLGLCVMGAFDQQVRVAMVTRLNGL